MVKQIQKNWYTEEEIRELWDGDSSPSYTGNIQVGENEELSIDFIREFRDKINWQNVSCWQHLSEKDIEEFRDKLDWWYVSKKQRLSLSFIDKFKEKLDWFWIEAIYEKKKDFLKMFKNYMDIKNE